MEDLTGVERRASRIKLLLMDCDGVLTDGRLMLLENGDEQKLFNVRDGQGLVLLHRAGLRSGVISGRSSSFVERRVRIRYQLFAPGGHTTRSKTLANCSLRLR